MSDRRVIWSCGQVVPSAQTLDAEQRPTGHACSDDEDGVPVTIGLLSLLFRADVAGAFDPPRTLRSPGCYVRYSREEQTSTGSAPAKHLPDSKTKIGRPLSALDRIPGGGSGRCRPIADLLSCRSSIPLTQAPSPHAWAGAASATPGSWRRWRGLSRPVDHSPKRSWRIARAAQKSIDRYSSTWRGPGRSDRHAAVELPGRTPRRPAAGAPSLPG